MLCSSLQHEELQKGFIASQPWDSSFNVLCSLYNFLDWALILQTFLILGLFNFKLNLYLVVPENNFSGKYSVCK